MNCKEPVERGKEKFWGQVFVCETCHELATHFFRRLEKDLKNMLVMAQESIRVSLTQGKFHFTEQGASKKAVLEEALRMESSREAIQKARGRKEEPCPNESTQSPTMTQLSGESTKPSAPHLDVLRRLGSIKQSPPDSSSET